MTFSQRQITLAPRPPFRGLPRSNRAKPKNLSSPMDISAREHVSFFGGKGVDGMSHVEATALLGLAVSPTPHDSGCWCRHSSASVRSAANRNVAAA